MDNIENIVILLFVIFSIISSIMNKKKKLANSNRTSKTPRKKGVFDILEEFNKSLAAQETNNNRNEVSEVDAYFEDNFSKKEILDTNENLKPETTSVSHASKFHHLEDDKFKETNLDLTYDYAENNLNSINQNLQYIRKLIRQPKSLRDYIIMKEILDKPKGLQEF